MAAIDLAQRRAAVDRFDPDPERSFTLPADYYFDPAIFEREKDAIFYRNWLYMGHAEQVAKPGDYITGRVLDQNIFIVRGKDNALRAFYNVCQHRAHELLEGSGHVKVITCPYHAWTYELDGDLRSARGSEKVANFEPAEFCLKPVQVETFMNFLFVNLDRDAPSLQCLADGLEAELRSFSPKADELTLAHRYQREVKANWKNVVENFSECYHCPISHPDFAANLVQMPSYRIETHAIYHSHRSRGTASGESSYDYDSKVSAHGEEFGGWLLWPNWSIEVFPGGYLNIFHNDPVAPEITLQTVEWYFFHKEPNEEERAVIDCLDEVRLEDIPIVESVQRGYHSHGYKQGRLVVDARRDENSEHAVHHFQTLVRKALGA
ncbi:MAG: Rieske 2Fe-2S domain-containing protein [Proteobacteria bacterium]|nr:Rieske 2Fe-2S domain-containing protein [Pseudomonadota bacterium]